MRRLQCWEFKKCGREPGGINVSTMGVCRAVTDFEANELNGGINGGRICWAVSGTFCGDQVQGTYAEKLLSCFACEFMSVVKKEEEAEFQLLKAGQNYPRHG